MSNVPSTQKFMPGPSKQDLLSTKDGNTISHSNKTPSEMNIHGDNLKGMSSVPSLVERSPSFVEGVTGPTSEYVILVSSDFHEFVIKRKAAYISPTLKRIFESYAKDLSSNSVSEVLVNYPSMIVSKVVNYLVYKEYYERTMEDAPKFSVDPAMVLEVLMASQFLDI